MEGLAWILGCALFIMGQQQAQAMDMNYTFLNFFNQPISKDILPECEELLQPHEETMCDKHIKLYFEKLQGMPGIGWPSWAVKSESILYIFT